MKYNSTDDLGTYFKVSIEKESKSEIESLTKEIEGLKAEARNQFIKELEEEKLTILASRARDIYKEYQEDLSVKQRTLDLLVMDKRMHLIDELFIELENKIKVFKETPQSKKWFNKKLNQYDIKLFDTIELNEKDKDLAPKGLNVKINNNIRAGFVLYNEKLNRVVSETISTNLKEARQYFYETAKWFSE
ncbi:hypothetical protein [Acholeplasma granularum]|uniref:hypothetical protein n=1 Tax=Acholeplasma granularum TaxID=264635 RepID=UPI000472AA4E|nr:hypothetical protein [Acholeplasma granularum]